jgi:hypothetical protein
VARLGRRHQAAIDLTHQAILELAAPPIAEVADQQHRRPGAAGERDLDRQRLAVGAPQLQLALPAARARERERATQGGHARGVGELEHAAADDRRADELERGGVGMHDATLAVDEHHALIERVEAARDREAELGLGRERSRRAGLSGERDAAAAQPPRANQARRARSQPRHDAELEREGAPALALAQPDERATEALALARARQPAEEGLADDRLARQLQQLGERPVVHHDEAGAVEHRRRQRQRVDDLAHRPFAQTDRERRARRHPAGLGIGQRRQARPRCSPRVRIVTFARLARSPRGRYFRRVRQLHPVAGHRPRAQTPLSRSP